MDAHPIHIPVVNKTFRTRPHTARERSVINGSRAPMDEQQDVAAPAILDEAFARFTRIDAPQRDLTIGDDSSGGWRATNQQLVSDLATQLEALDRQREQLARLLEQVNQ